MNLEIRDSAASSGPRPLVVWRRSAAQIFPLSNPHYERAGECPFVRELGIEGVCVSMFSGDEALLSPLHVKVGVCVARALLARHGNVGPAGGPTLGNVRAGWFGTHLSVFDLADTFRSWRRYA